MLVWCHCSGHVLFCSLVSELFSSNHRTKSANYEGPAMFNKFNNMIKKVKIMFCFFCFVKSFLFWL